MGGGGGKSQTQQSGQSHQVTKVELPPWVDKAGQENVAEAGRIAALPYQPYEGTLIPEFSQMTADTLQYMLANAGTYQDMYNEAGNATRALREMGGVRSRGDVASRGDVLSPDVERGNLKDYMNPYTDEVERRAIANAETAAAKGHMALGQKAQQARAFGGSRQAIEQGVFGAESVRGIGDLSAGLREKAYDKAVAAQQADWARQFQNVGNDISTGFRNTEMDYNRQFKNTEQDYARQFKNYDTMSGLSKQQAELAKAAQAGLTADYFQLLSGGKMFDDQAREKLEETYRKFAEKRDYPKEGLALRLSALGMTPYGRTETTDKTESSISNSKSSGGFDFGGAIGGGLGLLQLMGASDRDLKTNIEKLGKDPKLDLPVYAYDYKADVKGKKTAGPKRVGYMAQDVEKKYPKAVKKISGKRVIDFSQLPLG